jgi:hypothetical protein
MKSLVVHSITKVIRSLRDPKTTLVEYGNVKNRCKMAPVVDIDIYYIYLRIRRDRTGQEKRDLGGGRSSGGKLWRLGVWGGRTGWWYDGRR